ncbi:hypothetical protein Ancab_007107 [Ancistrocladus abbreviatus]
MDTDEAKGVEKIDEGRKERKDAEELREDEEVNGEEGGILSPQRHSSYYCGDGGGGDGRCCHHSVLGKDASGRRPSTCK